MLRFNLQDHWFAPYGILWQNQAAPIESQVGDFGEVEGLSLLYFSLFEENPLAEKIINGLVDMLNATGNEIISRGKYHGEKNPEPKKKRWVQIGNRWYRIWDMNQTQTWYLFIGVLAHYRKTGSPAAKFLLDQYFADIVDNGGKIIYDDKVTEEGHYFKHHFKEWFLKPFEYIPIGNMYPRGLSLFKAMGTPLFSLRTSFAIATVGWWGHWQSKKVKFLNMNDTDQNNTAFALWQLASYDKKYAKKYIEWEKKADDNMAWLKTRYEASEKGNPDRIQDELKYVLRMKMRAQYGV